MLVVPRGMVGRRLYSLQAIALALALFGASMPVAEIRQHVSPWRSPADVASRWTTLRRWLDAASSGRLFVGIRAPPDLRPLRRQAEQVATQLVGRSPSDSRFEPDHWRAFRAGEQAG